MHEDLSIAVPRVAAGAIATSGLWLFSLALLQQWLVAELVSVPFRVQFLLGHVSRCLWLGLGLGVDCAADACH